MTNPPTLIEYLNSMENNLLSGNQVIAFIKQFLNDNTIPATNMAFSLFRDNNALSFGNRDLLENKIKFKILGADKLEEKK